ncbi:Intraflagellar transport protein -like protein [Halotydeus destructor]|nr:Intraflagellar transport protein -like protein [Halotydeus destructor]
MRTTLIWSQNFRDRDGIDTTVADAIFHPDESQVVIAVGNRLHVYSAADGSHIQTLRGHKDNVLCLSFAKDGKRFASGSTDKQVIIWTSKLEGMLKFSHNEAVRCMQFNPVTHQLASCTSIDFGLWSPEQKSVSKHKVAGQINDCSWSSDGHYLALALSLGYVSIRSRSGEEKVRIDRAEGQVPVWGVCFNPSREDDKSQSLVVSDASQCISIYDMSGNQIGKEKQLDFDPLSVRFSNKGDYLLIGGSNRQALMYTKDGVLINSVCQLGSWVWKCKASPTDTRVAICSHDGKFCLYEIQYSTVHSLYKERYAYRVNMTDVIIQHLITEQKVRIKCRDLVKKVAVYKDRLAIQLSDKIVIYELCPDPSSNMVYKVKDKINKRVECTLLVIGDTSIVLCQDKKLQCLNFQGHMEREWHVDSYIRYIRATGGPPGKEGLLLGLKSGQIVHIFIDNPFPVPVIQITSAIRCLDLSTRRTKLAIVDDKGSLSVYSMKTKELLYQESNANSVAWNSQFEEMLAFTGSGSLSVKAANFGAYHQQMQGYIVGFCGPKIFCLQHNTVTTTEISLSTPMNQFIDSKMFDKAYDTACLKVTDFDWNQLAEAALLDMSLEVASKAFGRTRNWLHLELIHSYLQEASSSLRNKSSELSFLGDVSAYKNHFAEAAKLYKQAGHDDKAINMYSDLRMFDQAQELIRAGDGQFKKQLAMKKADWINNINEPRAAAEMYLAAGEMSKAIDIIGRHGWVDMLMTIVQQLDKGDRDGLSQCAQHLIKHKQYFNAAEVYKKIGDTANLALIYVKSYQWQEAFKLASEHEELREQVYLPYATWLAENEQFIEAQQAFHKAGKINEALHVLQQLSNNAINENRFSDAGYYCWILSLQCLDLANQSTSSDRTDRCLAKYETLQDKADIYYAYHHIHRFIDLLPLCYRCSSTNPLHNSKDVLPIVEFQLDDEISEREAIELIQHEEFTNGSHRQSEERPPSQWQEENTSNVQSLKINDNTNYFEIQQFDDSSSHVGSEDPFTAKMTSFDESDHLEFRPILIGRSLLRQVNPAEIFVTNSSEAVRPRYFKNLVPDMHITMCPSCNKVTNDLEVMKGFVSFSLFLLECVPLITFVFQFFHSDEFETQVLQTGHCPFCRKDQQAHLSLR